MGTGDPRVVGTLGMVWEPTLDVKGAVLLCPPPQPLLKGAGGHKHPRMMWLNPKSEPLRVWCCSCLRPSRTLLWRGCLGVQGAAVLGDTWAGGPCHLGSPG